MIKKGNKWYGATPSEQLRLEKMRAHRRKAYRCWKEIQKGNRCLDEFDGDNDG